jgi:hypothetical protein
MAAQVHNASEIRPRSVRRLIARAARAKRPVFIWGPPGIGKSEIVASYTNSLNNSLLIDLRMALLEPNDLRGYPWRNPETNTMDWSPPTDLPTPEQGEQYDHIVLFLDELNSAPPSVQAAAYQLILNRRIGQYKLPDNVIVIAAGNRENDRGVTYRMPAPLANRFCHIYMEVNFDDWQQWAIQNNIHPEVVGYLSHSKQDLFDFNPKSASTAFATPRSWTYVSSMIYDFEFDGAEHDEQVAEIGGAIGQGLALKFIEMRKVIDAMPKPEEIFSGAATKLREDLANQISAKYSLVVSMTYELAAMYKDTGINDEFRKSLNNGIKFSIDNFHTEMVILMLKMLIREYKVKFNIRDDLDNANSEKIIKDYGKYILDD